MTELFPVGALVGVINPEKPNWGLVGMVKRPFRLARSIPEGWVWVEFGSWDETWSCEYSPDDLLSIYRLGHDAFKKLIADHPR